MNRRATIMLCGVLGAGIFFGPNATAADDYIAEPSADAEYPIEEEPQSTGDIWNRETMTGDWGGLRTRIEDFGVHFTPTFTLAFLGNPSGGMWQGNTVNGLFNLQLDIDLEKASSGLFDGLLFHVNALYIFGPDLSKDFVGDFSGIAPSRPTIRSASRNCGFRSRSSTRDCSFALAIWRSTRISSSRRAPPSILTARSAPW